MPDILIKAIITAACIAIATWFFYCLAELDAVDECEIDAPMEQAQCRANGGRAVVHPVTGWGWAATK